MKAKTTKKYIINVCVFLVLSSTNGFADNPIIPSQGVCDPHIHIFNGKAYLFATHDEQPGNSEYTMNDWWIWSSPDLINWTLEFTLDPPDTYIGGPWSKCYATDGAERNGKYYFYFSKHSLNMGVAVSTTGPGGPYTDALGQVLNGGWDPTVFIDDDANQTPYFIYGYYPYKIMKMNEDMISFAESPITITHIGDPWSADGSFVHKHNGLYYLNCHGSNYGTSTNVYGPYTHRGKFYPGWTDHGTFFVWNNQDYLAYGMADTDRFFRKTNLTYVYYKDNGDMVADAEIAESSLGVGQYDSKKIIQAEWYFAASDSTSKNENASGFELRILANNSYLYFPNVRDMVGNSLISFRVSSANSSDGTIEVHADSANGTLLGSCTVPNTGSWTNYQIIYCTLTNSPGDNNITLVFKSTETEFVRLDYFRVQDPGPTGSSTLFTNLNPPGSGSIMLNPSGGNYDPGTVVTVTANPDPGYEFIGWGGDLSGTTNPTTITMTSNKSVMANFSSIIFTAFAANCGGSAFTSSDGTVYSADMNYSGGNTYSTGNAISGTDDDILYQSERYGDVSYNIPMPNGDYDVTLKFAEIYQEAAGLRRFDVLIEDSLVINNLDIWYKAGGKDVAYDEIHTVTLSDGVLNISLITEVNNAKISAIFVEPYTVEIANRDYIALPKHTQLDQNYPNPFNPETTIPYQLAQASHVKVVIYNTLGHRVTTLVDRLQSTGFYYLKWNGKNDFGKQAASGIYLCKLETDNSVQVKKIILMR